MKPTDGDDSRDGGGSTKTAGHEQQPDASGGDSDSGVKDGARPYSPSNPLDEESDMEWESNLSGVKELFRPPPPIDQEQGVPVGETVQMGGQVLPQLIPEPSGASKGEKTPPPTPAAGGVLLKAA
jgi:hypothetical protein